MNNLRSPIIEQSHFWIVGFGACTAVGLNAPSTTAAVRSAISSFAEHPFMVDQAGDRIVVAASPFLSDSCVGADRFCRLAKSAALEAIHPLRDFATSAFQLPVVIGGPPPERPGVPKDIANRVVEETEIALGEHCTISSINYTGGGHSVGLMAIELCLRKMRAENALIGLAGSVDSYLYPETLEWLEVEGQLLSPNNPWGFVPGEAAGFCLICTDNLLNQTNLHSSLECLALYLDIERNMIKTNSICTGRGLTSVFQKVLRKLPPSTKIQNILCDLNGEPYRADEYGFTTTRLSDKFNDPADFIAPADCWGDIGAATGPLLLALTESLLERSKSGSQYTLIWTSSEDGTRAAALLKI